MVIPHRSPSRPAPPGSIVDGFGVLAERQAGQLLAAGPPPAGLDRSRLRMVVCHGAGKALRAGFPATLGIPLADG